MTASIIVGQPLGVCIYGIFTAMRGTNVVDSREFPCSHGVLGHGTDDYSVLAGQHLQDRDKKD
jgi:hypothetical protein